MTTFEIIRKQLSEKLSKPVDKITLDSKIMEDLGADSLDIVEMNMSLEDEFNISISDELASSIVTVRDLVDFIDNYKK